MGGGIKGTIDVDFKCPSIFTGMSNLQWSPYNFMYNIHVSTTFIKILFLISEREPFLYKC